MSGLTRDFKLKLCAALISCACLLSPNVAYSAMVCPTWDNETLGDPNNNNGHITSMDGSGLFFALGQGGEYLSWGWPNSPGQWHQSWFSGPGGSMWVFPLPPPVPRALDVAYNMRSGNHLVITNHQHFLESSNLWGWNHVDISWSLGVNCSGYRDSVRSDGRFFFTTGGNNNCSPTGNVWPMGYTDTIIWSPDGWNWGLSPILDLSGQPSPAKWYLAGDKGLFANSPPTLFALSHMGHISTPVGNDPSQTWQEIQWGPVLFSPSGEEWVGMEWNSGNGAYWAITEFGDLAISPNGWPWTWSSVGSIFTKDPPPVILIREISAYPEFGWIPEPGT